MSHSEEKVLYLVMDDACEGHSDAQDVCLVFPRMNAVEASLTKKKGTSATIARMSSAQRFQWLVVSCHSPDITLKNIHPRLSVWVNVTFSVHQDQGSVNYDR